MNDESRDRIPDNQAQRLVDAAPPNTRWIVTAVLVCVAAIGGGAGAVFLASPEAEYAAPFIGGVPTDGHRIRGRCERLIEHTFNPRAVRGARTKMAKVAFRFSYETDPRYRDLVRRRIEDNWDLMYSRTLFVLRKRTAHELNAAESSSARLLERDLSDAITQACFPDGVAVVDQINYVQYIVR